MSIESAIFGGIAVWLFGFVIGKLAGHTDGIREGVSLVTWALAETGSIEIEMEEEEAEGGR